jgi:hypothetical protein
MDSTVTTWEKNNKVGGLHYLISSSENELQSEALQE